MRAKLRCNCHSLDVEERDKLESQLNMLSTAGFAGCWWPESTAHKKDRLKIENERHKESRPVILFVRRATDVIMPRMAELEEKLVALKQKKPVDSWSVEGCEGELFQLDWELRVFQKRFSLCLEPRHHPNFIHVKPKDNEVKLVRLQKLHSQEESGSQNITHCCSFCHKVRQINSRLHGSGMIFSEVKSRSNCSGVICCTRCFQCRFIPKEHSSFLNVGFACS